MAPQDATSVTYRIHRSLEPEGVVLLLSGELDTEHVDRLRELIEGETKGRVRLDLRDVTVVHRSGLSFLARGEDAGIVLVNCADYLRRLIAAEGDR